MPVSQTDRENMQARHFPGEVIGDSTGVVRCVRDGEPWPCDVTRLLGLAAAAAHFAGTWDELVRASNTKFLVCEEATSAAALWRWVGREATADQIAAAHAAAAPHSDAHHVKDEAAARA